MSEAARPEPIQPELPLDLPQQSDLDTHLPAVRSDERRVLPLPGVRQQPLTTALATQLWSRLRSVPWGTMGAVLGLTLVYLYRLGRASARLDALRGVQRSLAVALHVAGLPAVVIRTVVQLTLAHRVGVAIEQTVFFRLNDPAGFVAYEAPGQIGASAAIAFVPALVLMVLSLLCLGPVVVPRPLLHLPVSWLTLLQLWLGLGFAAHVLPTFDEAQRLANQTLAGTRQADPVSLLWAIPAQIAALVARLGSLPAAGLGVLAALWLAGFLFPH